MNAEVILQRLECVRRNGIGWMALCSAHADKENLPTNRRTQREDLPKCSKEAVCAALGIERPGVELAIILAHPQPVAA